MKIFYLANIRFPTERAHGAQIAKMCEAFADEGADLTLVIPNRMINTAENPYEYYGIKHNFKIVKIGNLENPKSSIQYWISYIKFILHVPSYCLKHRADVYYSRDESIVFMLALFGIKAVWEAHGWKDNVFTKYFLNKINKIVVITGASKKRFVNNGVPENKMLVAPDGIDESFLAPAVGKALAREKLGLPAEGVFAFYIGGLEEWKGYRTFLRCADTLASHHITAVIVGGRVEWLEKEFPQALFLGFTPYKDLATVQSAADILVIPNSAKSIVSTEYTSPLKLFAHMASNRPIVASDLPSLREILNEETAYFFEPDNHESLTKSIKHAVMHPDEANEKAKAALQNVRKYTWGERARRILSFIQT